MAHINRKYIDSHWLIFVIKGLVAILIGGYTLFNPLKDRPVVTAAVGIFLLCFSIIEFTNAIYRVRQKTGWTVAVMLAVIDAVVALALILTSNEDALWHLYIISAYTFIRGFAEIVAGFRMTVDPTDRFVWVFSGMIGAIMGIVILNSSNLFINYFGAYLLIIGTCSLFYGVHNRAQKIEDSIARKESAAKRAKARKKAARKIVKRSK